MSRDPFFPRRFLLHNDFFLHFLYSIILHFSRLFYIVYPIGFVFIYYNLISPLYFFTFLYITSSSLHFTLLFYILYIRACFHFFYFFTFYVVSTFLPFPLFFNPCLPFGFFCHLLPSTFLYLVTGFPPFV